MGGFGLFLLLLYSGWALQTTFECWWAGIALAAFPFIFIWFVESSVKYPNFLNDVFTFFYCGGAVLLLGWLWVKVRVAK